MFGESCNNNAHPRCHFCYVQGPTGPTGPTGPAGGPTGSTETYKSVILYFK